VRHGFEGDLRVFQRYDGILQVFGWLLDRFSGPCLSAVWLEIFGRVKPVRKS